MENILWNNVLVYHSIWIFKNNKFLIKLVQELFHQGTSCNYFLKFRIDWHQVRTFNEHGRRKCDKLTSVTV